MLNAAELAARVDPWLRSGGLTRAACGRLFFTWNAFRIDCDPQSAVRIVEAFDLRSPDVRDGALYADPRGTAPVRLSRTSAGPGGATYAATVALDPKIVRRERAASDVGVGEIARRPMSLPDALRAHVGDAISGTITVTFGADANGQVERRVRVTRYSVTSGKGTETGTVTETLTRRRLP